MLRSFLWTGRRCAVLSRKSSRQTGCFYFATDGKCTDDKFEWMDNALSTLEVREQDVERVQLDDHYWAEFAETGSIEPTDHVLKKLERIPPADSICEISEEFVHDFLQLEGEDISDIIDTSNCESTDENMKKVPDSFIDEVFGREGLESLFRPADFHADNSSTAKTASSVHSWRSPAKKPRESRTACDYNVTFPRVTPKMRDARHARTQVSKFAASTLNSTKPSFDKRNMQKESEMGRIVEEVLATRYSEWNKCGASVLQVALSPNSHDLTVYYQAPNNVLRTMQWKKLLKRITANIRSAISKRQPRYTPKVHFQCGSTKTHESDNLDDLLELIARERESIR